MKYDLLKMVQMILASMDSDEVNDINDTVESRQVIDIIEQTYNDLVSTIDFPEHWNLFELDPSGDPDMPTVMYIPSDIAKIEWIQYDTAEPDDTTIRQQKTIKPLLRDEFFNRMNNYDTDDDNVYSFDYLVGAETFQIVGRNDIWPDYYTLLEDNVLIFDNYRVDVGATLLSNRTTGYGMSIPTFTRNNVFIPDLDARSFSLLFNEAKAQAFIDMKQTPNGKAEQRARRAWINSGRVKHRGEDTPAIDCAPAYGRRRR